ncbi:MAG: M15 family metallopeptidase [Acidimicrobiales bacterium]
MYTRPETGSAPLTIMIVLGAASIVLAAMATLGRQALDAAQARTAADAAALAAALDGQSGASALARTNAATLGSLAVGGTDHTASVVVQGQVARATARRVSYGDGARSGLSPAMLAALSRAEELIGSPVPIVSGYRSPADQQRLWDNRDTNPYPVARPGTSRHELGLAIDVPLSFVPTLAAVASASGLCHPLPVDDPVHFIVCPNPR